jgi:ADP-dependent NAD(P)H-hydrate dehydratase / NAD(P)H-hydrate epimerase
MKILSANEIREWDAYTLQHEPISSLDLMERAAARCLEWLELHYPSSVAYSIFCGKGNNGGDGLALARMLSQKDLLLNVYILEFGHLGTEDFQANLARLHHCSNVNIHFLQSEKQFPAIGKDEIVIDALLGSGINRKMEGVTERLALHLNRSGAMIISIDIPSGMFVDSSSKGNTVVEADHTLSFQSYKSAFLVAENSPRFGKIHILDIGLHPAFYQTISTEYEMTDPGLARSIYKPRDPFSHKGNYGHALVAAGSYGKMGAAILAALACTRSGTGLLTCLIPSCGYEIMQATVPEAMVITDKNKDHLSNPVIDPAKFNAAGIGPGIGTEKETVSFIEEFINNFKMPLVIDADALNILSQKKGLLKKIPEGSILTPHPKEFDRLFGEQNNDFERIDTAKKFAARSGCVVVLKAHRTFIATPGEKHFFNSTGNAGMAKGGSGDVLTGILTGLLAQGYTSTDAAVLGVYLHGLAGDCAANKLSEETMIARDIIESLGEAFSLVHPTV